MANENLSTPIEIQASYIVPNILPDNFSETYRRIVLSGADDMAKVAGRANEAGAEAFDAQKRNDEQDVVLEDHEERLGEAEQTIVEHGVKLANHEERITKTEEDLSKLEVRVLNVEQDVDGLKIKIQDLDGQISEIKVDYVSLSKTEKQKLLSPIDVSTSYSVNGTKVVGTRVTGFTSATGTALKSSFNANQSYSFSADYTRSEIQTLANGLIEARQRIKALEDALRSHGLID
ncbi:phage tail protein [Proteus mirabilis]|uniref:phage tail protein n=1 Tax=Proteus mirabilis TaxID=584 RepID=UPI0013D773AD|nr:phage tail protein [Proteus mirabilis]ELA6761604.1 phage tail protein [Proteus mirabilis]ELA7950997.1 phage tail protein [Proteus mirabilis]MBG2776206.1 phage tail protein [Proteus mirabilis]MBG2793647.1 phage tail protein [Proteus mirabilis]MBI6347403.1 phage tail protein [Proteus mirabilis]